MLDDLSGYKTGLPLPDVVLHILLDYYLDMSYTMWIRMTTCFYCIGTSRLQRESGCCTWKYTACNIGSLPGHMHYSMLTCTYWRFPKTAKCLFHLSIYILYIVAQVLRVCHFAKSISMITINTYMINCDSYMMFNEVDNDHHLVVLLRFVHYRNSMTISYLDIV